MAILGIMSMAVIPVFSGTFGRVQRDHAVRDFIATVKYAQERAVTDTREYRIFIDPETSSYWLMRLDKVDDMKKVFKPLEERQGEKMILPDRLSIDKVKAKKDRKTKAYYIAFYPNGVSDRASIAFRRDDGRALLVDLKGSLGDMKVSDRR